LIEPSQNPSHLPAAKSIAAVRVRNAVSGYGVAVLLLVYFALWTVTGRYWGLQHDAQLYAAQALAKIRPDAFSGDLFLRFASQDDFTLFPYFYAWIINLLGLDHGAAMLTISLFIGWMLLAWRLARALIGREQAWLAIGLLIVVPGWYGAGLVFRTVEPFLSARPAAEVVCLGAFLAFIHGQRIFAAALLALAAVIHPIMAFAAALAMICLSTPWHELRLFWPVAAVFCCAGAVAGAFLFGGDSAFMAHEWLQMTKSRSSYLFPQNWNAPDWQTNLLPLLTVLFASQVLVGWPKRLAQAAFWIGTCGLLLAMLAATVLPLKLLLQGQPWRWIWLANIFAIMFLPSTLSAAWRHSTAGRVVALMICIAWLLTEWSSADQLPPVGVAGVLLIGSQAIWWARAHIGNSHFALLQAGAIGGVGLTLLGLAMSIAAVLKGQFDFGGDPIWVQKTADMLEFVAVPAGLVTAAWWVTVRSWSPACAAVAGITAAVLAIGATPGAANAWFAETYSASARATFSGWRDRIPAHAEVLWPEGLPQTWFLLDRRSYMTVSQLGGIVFSEALATEARRRALILEPLVPVGHWFLDQSVTGRRTAQLTNGVLTEICVTGGPDFIVDDEDLGLYTTKIEWPTRAKFMFLYDCRDIRRSAPAAQL